MSGLGAADVADSASSGRGGQVASTGNAGTITGGSSSTGGSTSGGANSGGLTGTAPSTGGGAAPAPAPAPAPGGSSAGSLSAEAYRSIAAQMSQDAGIEHRFGPGPGAYGTTGNNGLPTLFKRTDTYFVSDRNGGSRACDPGPPNLCGTYQMGTFDPNAGNYSSNFGHVGYVADNPSSYQGIAGIHITGTAHNTFAQNPELSWTLYGAGLNEVNAAKYKQQGLDANRAVAVARAYGRPGWGAGSIVAYQNGLLGVSGNNTTTNKATAQLAAGKVPTAMAMTNGGEFALVTMWDTNNLRGQVAVVAVAGQGEQGTNGSSSNWWGEWKQPYPGLPNLGNITFLKVLGYIDLPEMTAPTSIAVTTAWDPWAGRTRVPGTDPNSGPLAEPYSLELSNETNRLSFRDNGSNRNSTARVGMAVVASKSEKKVSFIDLKPLLDFYKRSYFDSSASEFAAAWNNRGTGADQWPLTFARDASQQPKVVQTITLPEPPTAVQTTLWGSAKRAFVATQEGKLRMFSLDQYLTVGTTGTPASIRQVGEVTVGRNPTHISTVRDHITVNRGTSAIYPSLNEVIVVSRGDRRIEWVRASGSDFSSGSVVRTVRDSRLVDPIAADDTDNHGTESYVLAVADYGGKQIANYRYGPVVFYSGSGVTYPVQGTGGVDAEFGGSFAMPGRPFYVNTANVP